MEALNVMKKPAVERPVYEYELPEELVNQDEHVTKSMGFVKLTVDEEIAAADRAGQSKAKLAFNFLRAALVEVDGRRINKAEGEDETIIRNVDPQIRDLMLTAFADISNANDVMEKKFLRTRKVKVG